jgi:uncharacterized protein (TIGR00730 family)
LADPQVPMTASGSLSLAVDDGEFLRRDELRGIRFALEYEKAELILRDWKIRSTIIVFGSARVPSPEIVETLEREALETADPLVRDHARRLIALAPHYEQARQFGRIVSQQGGALAPKDGEHFNVIATGGGPGIMEAANRGASDVKAPSIGFNISLPREEAPNPYSTPDLTFRFHYFAMRKMHLAMRARALTVFPGGFGTLDELFEILTLQQTGKGRRAPVVLVGAEYWRTLINFDWMVEQGTIAADDVKLFHIVDSAEEAWFHLVSGGVLDPDGPRWPRPPKPR